MEIHDLIWHALTYDTFYDTSTHIYAVLANDSISFYRMWCMHFEYIIW